MSFVCIATYISSQRVFSYTVGVEITRGPLNVSNAIVGGTASFECILNSTSLFPRWNINGYNFTVTNLPVGFQFESNSYSKVLTVNPVRQEMNNWCFYCFIIFSSERIESSRAKLTIQSPTETSSYYTFRSTPTAYPPTLSSAVPTSDSQFPAGENPTAIYLIRELFH